MSVNAIMSNALSALYVNQEAMRVTSNNIANVNSPNYARKSVHMQPINLAGQSAGVEIAEIRRVVDTFFARESLFVTSTNAQFDTQSTYFDQIQSLFGSPDQGLSLPARIDTALAAFGDLSLDAASAVRRADAMAQLTQMTDSFARLSNEIQTIRTDIDRRINDQVSTLNGLFEQVFELNQEIERATVTGGDATSLQDQRDGIVREISTIIDVRVTEQANGSVHLATQDGFSLVGALRTELSYTLQNTFSAGLIPGTISGVLINSQTGQVIPPARDLDPHIAGGELRGLLNMRDQTLPALATEVGNLAASVADELNAIHNNSAAVPAPNALTGRNTGLLSGDAHGFSGQTSVAVTATDGTLVSRIDIDFDAGTYSVDGGGAVAFGGTIGDLATALNAALGGNGSASFTNGVFSVQASNAANGIAFLNDAANPSARVGRGFSHFFGLNDLITAAQPSHFQTGVSGAAAHGFTPGETIDFVVRHPDGRVATETSFTIGAGATFNDIISDLNNPATGLGSYVTFSLNANGELSSTPTATYSDYELMIRADGTDRGGTGVSLTQFFGLTDRYTMDQARDMAVVPAVTQNNQNLALAQLDLNGAVAGDIVISQSDNRGALAFEALSTKTVNFSAAGFLTNSATSLTEYGALVLADFSTRSAQMESLKEDSTALLEEIELRRTSVQGVNMDEELANMVIYQQAYNSAARLITTAQEMLDTLLGVI